jgi:translation elongation factor EF-Tu-like GTPase
MTGFAEVLIELLPTDKGGRRTPICLSTDTPTHYRPHFRVRGGDGEVLGVEFVDGPDEPLAPGGSTYATVRFVYEPEVCYDALALGAEFDILEGGRVVGVGRVSRR